jgi:hypothetical protein
MGDLRDAAGAHALLAGACASDSEAATIVTHPSARDAFGLQVPTAEPAPYSALTWLAAAPGLVGRQHASPLYR